MTDLEDFSSLRNVRKIEGGLNVFRSPGFLTLHGLENLEMIEGFLTIRLNPNLRSLAALAKLHTVTGNLLIVDNDQVPQAEVELFVARLKGGGAKALAHRSPR